MPRRLLFFCFFLMLSSKSIAQCEPGGGLDCAKLELIRTTSSNVDFIFDDFRKYVTGLTYSGSTVLRVVADSLDGNPNCQWRLMMYLDNGFTGEWEQLVAYGSSDSIPTLDLLQVKVYNSCGTPIVNNTYQSFEDIENYVLAIIPVNPPVYADCDGNPVNTVGSYLTNYQEFSFTIDYRIKPGFAYRPGAYQLKINFCLVEIN